MASTSQVGSRTRKGARTRAPWLLTFAIGTTLVILGILWRGRPSNPPMAEVPSNPPGSPVDARPGDASDSAAPFRRRFHSRPSADAPGPTPEQIVAGKLADFAKTRRRLAHALAQRHQAEVTPDVERFFDAVESGDWEAIEAAFKVINGGDWSAGQNANRPEEIRSLWPAIIDAFGAAEQVHEWPARELLDYGNAILGSLSPGMIYVGGTDNGRWIPALLNDSSDGGGHVVITQNGLADTTYLDYVRLQYEDRMATLSEEDSSAAFQEYVEDARKRLEHDQQFPGEPRQVRPSEEIQITDGKVQVSGQVAVMTINGKLLQKLMEKNPGLSFGIQESYPLKETYPDALPLGPLMELGAADDQNTFTPERAAQSLAYWQNVAQQAFADADVNLSTAALKSYSHDVVASAHLLASHAFASEAEVAFRLASQFFPGNPESIGGLADLLVQRGQQDEARDVLLEFARQHPDQREELDRISAAWRAIGPAPPAGP